MIENGDKANDDSQTKRVHGKGKAVYAPSVPGQVKALKRAYEESGLDPKDIGLIEAHGTGTAAGDKVEVEALKEVYGVSETSLLPEAEFLL